MILKQTWKIHQYGRGGGIALMLLLVATAVGLGARVYAVRHYTYSHVDEEIARAVVSKVMRTHSADTNWARTDVDAAFRYDEYNFSSYYLFASGVEMAAGHTAVDLAHPYFVLRLHLRELSAILGGLCILFAGILGFRLGGAVPGLLAGLLTACSANLFQDSLYARPEAFATLLSLAYCIALTVRSWKGVPALAVSGFTLGLLVACKFTFLMYFPFPLLLIPAFAANLPSTASENQRLAHWSGYVLLYLAFLAVGFCLGAPYAVKNPWEYLAGVSGLMRQYLGNAPEGGLLNVLSVAANRLDYYAYSIGYPALILAAVGTYALFKQRKISTLLLFGGPLITLLYFLQTKLFIERNASQAVPILFVLAGLGLGTVAQLLEPKRKLRFVSVGILAAAAILFPLAVTATLIDPVLDGKYQAEIDSQAASLSQNGRLPVIYVGRDIGSIKSPLCGSYFLMTRSKTYTPEYRALLRAGYTQVAQVISPLHRGSSLEPLFAPTTIFLAAPPSASPTCELDFSALDTESQWKTIHATVDASPSWTVGGARASAAGWAAPLYGSWSGSDWNTGQIKIGPFAACQDFAVPFAMSPARTHVEIEIARRSGNRREVIFSGLPPAAPYRWFQLLVKVPGKKCAEYTVTGNDEGRGWGEWIGLGVPAIRSTGNRPQ